MKTVEVAERDLKMDKPVWPKTKEGTTNWEELFENAECEGVFENAETGLIPQIVKIDSVSVLRDSALNIANLLYLREEDLPVIERFTGELQDLLPHDTPEDALPHMVKGVIAI